MTTPIVIFSDHPAASSGLARITRDLAWNIHCKIGNEFRVATLGYGHCGSAQFPFPQYHWNQRDDFLPLELPFIWKDFCGDDLGVLLTIGDIQRFLPLADTQFCQDRGFAQWWSQQRSSGHARLWGYFPIDAHGIGGKLPPQLAHTLTHYDRVLVPSEWAAEIVRKTIPGIKVDAIPHGIDTDVFKPYPKDESRARIGELLFDIAQWPKEQINVGDDALWVGIVATNQARKDWGLGIEVVSELKKSRPVFLWAHTDRLKSEWSLLESISDFGLLQSSLVTVGNVSDQSMAIAYSAMDLTIAIGRGEGYCYPAFESLACGTRVVAGTYGAQAEHLTDVVPPRMMRIEGPLNLLRPVYGAKEFADMVSVGYYADVKLPDELDWNNLWPHFSQYFKDGLK